jgi:PAS domain S-box-containing protein
MQCDGINDDMEHVSRQGQLLVVSERVLAETTVEGLLQRIVDAACELTGARFGVAGHGQPERIVRACAGGRGGPSFEARTAGSLLEQELLGPGMLGDRPTLRLTDTELRSLPAAQTLPDGHPELHGLLAARLEGHDAPATGVIVLSYKESGDFTAADELLLGQLASLGSLGLHHIQAHADAQRRAAELDRERQSLRAVMAHTQAQLAYLDRDFVFLEVNAAYVAGSGHCRDELIGHNHFALFPDAANQAIFEQVRDSGEPIEYQAKPSVFAGQPERGTTYWDWTLTPIKDTDGGTRGLVLSLLEVTTNIRAAQERERLLAQVQAYAEDLETANRELQARYQEIRSLNAGLEERVAERTATLQEQAVVLRAQAAALAESEARFRAIFERAGIGIALADTSGRVVRSNSYFQNLLGYSEDELGALTIADYTCPEDRTPNLEYFTELLAGQRDFYQLEKRCVRKDGSLVWVSVTGTVAQATDGKPVFAIAMVKDISRRKQTEAALEGQRERLRILHEIDRAILAAGAPAEIAQVAADYVRRVVPSQRAVVILFDGEEGVARLLAASGRGCDRMLRVPVGPLQAWRGTAELLRGEQFVVEDLRAAPDPLPLEQAMADEGARAYYCIPLMIGGQALGALVLWLEAVGRPSSEHQEIAGQVADSLAVALHNARLAEQIEASRQGLQNLSHWLVRIQENERKYVAKELFDNEGQRLSVLLISLGLLERRAAGDPVLLSEIGDLKRLADSILEDMHGLAVNLRPASLDRLGLAAALRQYADQFACEQGIRVQVELAALKRVHLAPETETALYRIGQEALSNVAEHAHAAGVCVIASYHAGRLTIVIEDDGAGFDVAEAIRLGRLGILSMRERAKMVGGSLTIESAPGGGTTVYVGIPVADHPAA